jgi:hypothetical protein
MEMKPEKWFIGFQMGSEINLMWKKQMNEFRFPDTTDAAGAVTANNDTTLSVNYIDWTSTIDMSYGFYVPLPDEYRLDFSLNGQNLFEFESVALQLIVPLN